MSENDADPPVCCTLTPAELTARRDDLLPGLLSHTYEREELPNGWRFRFRTRAGLAVSIMNVIEAERQCCRFLQFHVTFHAGLGPIDLEVTGPAGTRELLKSLLVEK